jgi:hypothetical protein
MTGVNVPCSDKSKGISVPLGGIIFFIVAIPVVIFAVVRNLCSDRMVNVKHRDYDDTDWVGKVGKLTSCEVFDVAGLSEAKSLEIAELAIKAAGGQRMETHDNVVQAWAPFSFPYPSTQIGVRVQSLLNDVTRFECCCRPRYSTTLADFGRVRRSAAKIRNQITLITNSK